jgi:hypothetical protein
MIDIKVTTIGGPEIAAKLADASTGIRDEIRDEIAAFMDDLVAGAQAAAPVRTGGLRSRIIWYFGREMKRGPRGAKRMVPVDVNWKGGRIEATARPRGRVAHLMERGVNATFSQRVGRGAEPEKRYGRSLHIAPRPFFTPAIEALGSSEGLNDRLQARLDRLAAGLQRAG